MEVLNSHFSALSQPFCRKTCLTSRATSRLFVALSRPTVFIPATLVFGGFDPPSERQQRYDEKQGDRGGRGAKKAGRFRFNYPSLQKHICKTKVNFKSVGAFFTGHFSISSSNADEAKQPQNRSEPSPPLCFAICTLFLTCHDISGRMSFSGLPHLPNHFTLAYFCTPHKKAFGWTYRINLKCALTLTVELNLTFS